MIGSEKKKSGCICKRVWMEKVKDIQKINSNIALILIGDAQLVMLGAEGKKPNELDSFLLDQYKIHTVAITLGKYCGSQTIRRYTTTKNLDI